MFDLSPRQQDVLEFFLAHVDQQGLSPSHREIGEALGITSTNAVHDHLERLIAKGYLRRVGQPKSPRSFVVTAQARQYAAVTTMAVAVYAAKGR